MKTDTLFYRFFQEFPECLFELVGLPASEAKRYRFDAIELKDTAVRMDGVYTPREPDDAAPVLLVEYQNHRSERVYSNLLLKVGLYLEKINPRQNWHGIVIYPRRSIEQENLLPYRFLLESDQLTRIYLDDVREAPDEKFGFSILRLIIAKQADVVEIAKQLIPRVRSSAEVAERKRELIELIETVVLYQWPGTAREEVEKMLKLDDLRHTRVIQDAIEEGRKEGREEGREKGVEMVALRMLEMKTPPKQIAECTGLSLAEIKQLKKNQGK